MDPIEEYLVQQEYKRKLKTKARNYYKAIEGLEQGEYSYTPKFGKDMRFIDLFPPSAKTAVRSVQDGRMGDFTSMMTQISKEKGRDLGKELTKSMGSGLFLIGKYPKEFQVGRGGCMDCSGCECGGSFLKNLKKTIKGVSHHKLDVAKQLGKYVLDIAPHAVKYATKTGVKIAKDITMPEMIPLDTIGYVKDFVQYVKDIQPIAHKHAKKINEIIGGTYKIPLKDFMRINDVPLGMKHELELINKKHGGMQTGLLSNPVFIKSLREKENKINRINELIYSNNDLIIKANDNRDYQLAINLANQNKQFREAIVKIRKIPLEIYSGGYSKASELKEIGSEINKRMEMKRDSVDLDPSYSLVLRYIKLMLPQIPESEQINLSNILFQHIKS